LKNNEQSTERSQRIRQVMQTHVADRLVEALDKWKGKDDAQARKGIADAREKYQLARILEKGAKANGMAVATHIAKGVHPDLKIKSHTNLHVRFDELASLNELGSHILHSQASIADTTGDGAYNAAAYELYLLLACRVDDASLAELLRSGDADAVNSLSTEAAEPAKFAEELLFLLESKCAKPAVHTLSKQVYWLTGSNPVVSSDYHLLAPLYPASLTHQAYLQIHPTRYGKENAAARKAKAEGKAHDGVCQEYRDWATQKMGGTKPQNVSHLNSERRGENYLLASLPPPARRVSQRYLPLHASSVFERAFGARLAVRDTVKAFLAFLLTDPKPNRSTRQQVDDFLNALVDELVIYVGEMQSQSAGWTLDERYDDLVVPEKLWLDPRRAELPEESKFAQDWYRKEWPVQVGKRFANWLNAQLQGKLPVGDAEALKWQRALLADESWFVTGGAA
jgi:CRISPR-associated protein Csy1